MANVKGGPEFRVYINWKTGYLAELEEYPRSKEQAAEGLEQVFLCWHDGSDALFIDPVIVRKEPRHMDVEYLTLIEFCTMIGELTGTEMLYKVEPGRIVSHWKGESHSAVLNASLKPEDSLTLRMKRLGAAVDRLTQVVESLI